MLRVLKNSFENIIIIKLRSLEDKYPELLAAKKIEI